MKKHWILIIAAILVIAGLVLNYFTGTAFDSGQYAKGYFASGQYAVGVFAAGSFAIGIFSAGIFSIGIFGIGIFNIAVYGIGLFLMGYWKKYLKLNSEAETC
jgi:hypothetical protein